MSILRFRERPGPSAVYPTLAQLEDEGLITLTRVVGQKLGTLTDTGSQHAQDLPPTAAELPNPVDGGTSWQPRPGKALDEVQTATRAVATSGTDAQIDAVHQTLAQARRTIYLSLADKNVGADTTDPDLAI